jgi:dihydrofolate reductase
VRKIIAFERVTAEGFFSDANGNEQTLFIPEPDLDKDLMSGPTDVDTFLWGRRTYEHMEAYWPQALDNPDLPPAQRRMAALLNESAKFVFSRTLKRVTWKNSHLIRKFDPREVQAMKNGPGKDMMVLGSGSILSLLTQYGLVDEYQLVVSPRFLGRGTPLFNGVTTPTGLRLMEARGYRGGNVLLRYARTAGLPPD